MSERLGDMPNPEIEQVKIILNTLYLCIGYALRHVARHEGEGAAYALQANMLDAIKNGDIVWPARRQERLRFGRLQD